MFIRSFAFNGRWFIICGQMFMGLSAWTCLYFVLTLDKAPLDAYIYLGLIILRGIMVGGKWAVRPDSTKLFLEGDFTPTDETVEGHVNTTKVKLVGDEFVQTFGSVDITARTILKEIKLNEALVTGVSEVRSTCWYGRTSS